MKHILTMFLVSFLGIGTIQAQTKILGRKVFDRGIQSHTFIPKGQWMVGSTFSYSEHEDDNYKFLVLEKIESTGYTDLGNISLDLDDDINFDISDVNYLEHTFSATGFVRTYMPIGSSKIFGLFNEARVTYGYGQGKNSSGTDTDYTGTYQTIQNLQIGMAPGLTAFITNFAAVEVSVGVLGFNMKWTDQTTDQIDKGSRRSSSANFKIDLFSINLGMNFYF